MTPLTLGLLLAQGEAFRKAISAHYPIPRRLIDVFPAELDFELLSQNRALAWDEGLLTAHQDRWDWRALAHNPVLPWTVELIRKHVPERWAWDDLMWQPRVFAEPALLALCLPHWSPPALEGPHDFADAGGYRYFRAFAPGAAAWAHEVVEAASGVAWDLLSAVRGFPWTADFIARNAHRLDWKRLSWNHDLPWSIELLQQFENRWDWSHLSPGLPWSEALIAAFAERWSWRSLAAWVPWSEALLDRFSDQIWWAAPTFDHGNLEGVEGVINHQGFSWTPALYQRHQAAVGAHFERLRRWLAAGGEGLAADDEEHWTYHCDTGNWSAAMLALAEAHEARTGAKAVNWDSVCRAGQHLWGDKLVVAQFGRLQEGCWHLVANRHFPWHRYLGGFADALEPGQWQQLSKNPGLMLSRELLERFHDRWSWPALSSNPSLTEELIATYADRWDWRDLSRNPALGERSARAYADRLHGPSLTNQPWASPRTAEPGLPWDWYRLCGREPAALRERLDEPLLEAFLTARAARQPPR